MTRAIRFEAEASEELADAATWYEQQRPGLSDRFLGAVEASVARIGAWPEAAPLVAGLGDDQSVRLAPVRRFPYRLVYLVHEDVVRVLAVAHNRRKPRYWQDRVGPPRPDEQGRDPA